VNDRLRARATLRAIPMLLRPAAISEARIQVFGLPNARSKS
jgi:hypothetical protein